MHIREYEIPVPWGHIAVKSWGREENIPVLAVHGLGDNAGTFDRLLPFLPSSFYYICIDLPSHGKSSRYPPHLHISALDNIVAIKLVLDYLGRKKFILMGHSWGGQAGVLFTQLYPKYITKLIVLDSFYLFPVSVSGFRATLSNKIQDLIRINENVLKNKQPLYTYEEAVTKLTKSRFYGELFRSSAEALLERSLIPVEGGKFRFATDPRLKVIVNNLFDMSYAAGLVRKYPIRCPSLYIIASGSDAGFYYFKRVVKELQKDRRCVIEKVAGSHDVHNNNPEIVGPIISKFLLNGKSNL